jgi:hypothetical protein
MAHLLRTPLGRRLHTRVRGKRCLMDALHALDAATLRGALEVDITRLEQAHADKSACFAALQS